MIQRKAEKKDDLRKNPIRLIPQWAKNILRKGEW